MVKLWNKADFATHSLPPTVSPRSLIKLKRRGFRSPVFQLVPKLVADEHQAMLDKQCWGTSSTSSPRWLIKLKRRGLKPIGQASHQTNSHQIQVSSWKHELMSLPVRFPNPLPRGQASEHWTNLSKDQSGLSSAGNQVCNPLFKLYQIKHQAMSLHADWSNSIDQVNRLNSIS